MVTREKETSVGFIPHVYCWRERNSMTEPGKCPPSAARRHPFLGQRTRWGRGWGWGGAGKGPFPALMSRGPSRHLQTLRSEQPVPSPSTVTRELGNRWDSMFALHTHGHGHTHTINKT